MGIKGLNYFLKRNCKDAIKKEHLRFLNGKSIAVDTSIYLYKFKMETSILAGMFTMCSLFKYYNITPIFVFDGKPPVEKEAALNERRIKKDLAESKYNTLKKELETCDKNDKASIEKKLKILKKQFIRIKNSDVRLVKKLFRYYGIQYVECEGEADQGCRQLCQEKKVYACLSEDMDMFALGCPRVLRYFSLYNHTVVIYDLKYILLCLNMKFTQFQNLCYLSSTDYHKSPRTVAYYYNKLLYEDVNFTIPIINTKIKINIHVMQEKELHELLKEHYFLSPKISILINSN